MEYIIIVCYLVVDTKTIFVEDYFLFYISVSLGPFVSKPLVVRIKK